MKSFFKVFLASFLAMVLFSIVAFLCTLAFISGLASQDVVKTGPRAVLVLDLSKHYPEIGIVNPLNSFSDDQEDVPSLYDVLRMIRHAEKDSSVKGLYINCNSNPNGMASSSELRKAILDFKATGRFVYAYGELISQEAYYVASAADKLYCNPRGGVDWSGMDIQLMFMKGLLEKLEIEPQIFYAGRFKSATEPLRETKMTDANRLQLRELLQDVYGNILSEVGASRNMDTAALHEYASEFLIRNASDALQYKLVDGLKYDDEVRNEIKDKLGVDKYDKINFVSLPTYAKAVSFKPRGRDQIAVIYAAGDIMDGKGDRDVIGSETYRNLVRKARLNKDIKAIVFRINSGGGSALASEVIWRELALAKKEKPVVVSFGDVSASGGYYLSCAADSIFAMPNTITGSIGVFAVVPNLQDFFNHKLGITFDEVSTSANPNLITVAKPLSPAQRTYMQNMVDSTYMNFKERVANGRNLDMAYVDSIGQGRVWSGRAGSKIGLVDRLGSLDDAIACAARMAETSNYRLKEYPESHNLLDYFLGNYQQQTKQKILEEELGAEGMKTYQTLKKARQMVGVTQAKLPFEFTIQ